MRTLALLVALFWISLSASHARATTVPIDDGGIVTDRADLPLDTHDERVLLGIARTMPDTKAAMDEFRRRGYIAHPELDRAATPEFGTSAVCFLIYEKPGYVAPPNSIGAPVIMVGTIRSLDATRTRVSGGFVVMDRTNQSWYVLNPRNDPTPGVSIRDGGFEVGPDRWLDFNERQQMVLQEYALCAGVGNGMCVLGAVGYGLAATPVVGVGYGLQCVAGVTGGCFAAAMIHWPR